MLIFDIGCYDGRWIKANFDKEITFIGLEPNIDQYKECVKNFRKEPKVIIRNLLCADQVKEYDFYPADGVSTVSSDWITRSRHRLTTTWAAPYKVNSTTLNLLIEKYGTPDYIKIDVEGFEYEVLKGLTKKVGMIAFEFVEEIPEAVFNCLRYLKNLGYKQFNWIHGDQYNYIPEKWINYDLIVKDLKGTFRENREQCWGMIYII